MADEISSCLEKTWSENRLLKKKLDNVQDLCDKYQTRISELEERSAVLEKAVDIYQRQTARKPNALAHDLTFDRLIENMRKSDLKESARLMEVCGLVFVAE